MRQGKFDKEQIGAILQQFENGRTAADLAKEHGVSRATIYAWRSNYRARQEGPLDPRLHTTIADDPSRIKVLEDEIRQLQRLVVNLSLEKDALKSLVRQHGLPLPPEY